MKRKRFEKLLMGRHGMAPREVRNSMRDLIKLRRIWERKRNTIRVYSKRDGKFGWMVIYPYKEMLDHMANGEPLVGFVEEKA